MIVFLCRVLWTTDFLHSALWIYHAIPLWLAKFLLKDLQLALWVFLVSKVLLSSWCCEDFCFITIFCKFNYNISWCWPVFVDFDGSSFCFLDMIDLDVSFPSQIRGDFRYYFWKSFPFHSSWTAKNTNVAMFHGVIEFLKSILIFHNSSFFLLCSASLFSAILPSRSLIHSSAPFSPLFITSSLLPILFITFFVTDWLS